MNESKSVQRALIIFQALCKHNCTKEDIIDALQKYAPNAYTHLSPKAMERKFERDLDKLRTDFGANVFYCTDNKRYELRDVGRLLQVNFSADSFRALAFICETTEDNQEAHAIVKPLIDDLSRLMGAQLHQIEDSRSALRVDLKQLDKGVDPAVWHHVRTAKEKKRRLRFWYQSPNRPHGDPVLHDVEPYQLLFTRGHFYLHGYCVQWRTSQDEGHGNTWIRYRLDHILPNEIEILPNMIAPRQPTRHKIKFKVAPRLWQGGLSKRFDNMVVGEIDEDGWAMVTAETTDLFYARRILLGYGTLAVALEPDSLVAGLRETAVQMAEQYKQAE